ncbi:hypothetical protein INT80_14070 [Gallibacterium anatis]|uniref:Uncharacterized protein n=1 Tax=Gallibacterium anatis TaxID=750 RepID=A0A930UTK3_9PAST|nr:hypothetical protein [Gallibacterium anatis]
MRHKCFCAKLNRKGEKENAYSQIVLDNQSAVKNAWKLKERESLSVVLDKNGKVKLFTRGNFLLTD